MAGAQLWLGCVVALLVIVLMRSSRIPVALVALLSGVALGQATGISPRFPALDFGIHLPALTIPTWEQIVHGRSEEHTSELQSLMRISYAVFCLKKQMKNTQIQYDNTRYTTTLRYHK